jgi:hypothetical protein
MKKQTISLLLACAVALVSTGCTKKHSPDEILPGRHMSESQAIKLAKEALPLPTSETAKNVYRLDFKNGSWEMSLLKTDANGQVETTGSQVVVRIQDADGKVEVIK